MLAASVQDIPKILPTILNCIRMIWGISHFYNTQDRLIGLLRKLSSEIMNRCCAVISLTDIFTGNVEIVMAALEQASAARVNGRALLQQACQAPCAGCGDEFNQGQHNVKLSVRLRMQQQVGTGASCCSCTWQ